MAAPASSSSKVKILVFGSIGDDEPDASEATNDHEDGTTSSRRRVTWLLQRLDALHKSKAGPFDAAFVVGSCSPTDARDLRIRAESKSSPIPIPLYLHHLTAEIDDGVDKDNGDTQPVVAAEDDDNGGAEAGEDTVPPPGSPSDSDSDGRELPAKLGNNLYVLVKGDEGRSAGIWSLPISKGGGTPAAEAVSAPHGPRLVVAACPPRIRTDDSTTRIHSSLLKSVRHVSYRGCDVLLTVEPPQGADALLSRPDVLGSFDVSDVALQARPRYHFFPATFYRQSNPFAHVAAATSTAEGATDLHPPGRLIAMAPVSTSKDKEAKFVHALGMTPLLSMSTLDLQQARAQAQASLLPCPYTDAMYSAAADGAAPGTATATSSVGLSEASARRILAEERQKRALDGSSRWAQSSTSRGRGGDATRKNDDRGDANVDPSNTTLFVHGLHKDASGRLPSPEGDAVLLRAFARFGATAVRKPPGAATSSFAFVELRSHEHAARCLEETGGEVTVGGVHLTLKWASQHGADSGRAAKKARADHPHHHPARMSEAEAKDSTVLYFKVVHSGHDEATGEAVRSWAEQVLEAALNENASSDEDRVTAKDEPALRVEVRVRDAFGFLDFASHAAASMVIATLTGSVDGGQVVQGTEGDSPGRPDALLSAAMMVHWARAKSTDHVADNVIEDASGFKFERKHFPADSRLDCWFCLASESCEKHLITGVYDTCYAAMPKGPVHPGHVLLIPIRHTSRGSLQDGNVASEMESLKEKLRDHAASKYDCDLFVFERAIQTKGGYHTHVQCVPVERQLGQRLVTTMMAQAHKTGMNLKEIKSDIGAAALLADGEDDDGDEGGYFYAEIPMTPGVRRFLHKQVPGGHRGGTVPLQFGREVLAAVLGKPDMAHWKSCLLDKDQEAKLASEFRESFVV